MPIYEFYCARCGNSFEELCGANAAPPPCPTCGADDVARQVTMPSPLKKGAFPFKPGPVHPLAKKWASGSPSACSTCGGSCNGNN